MLARLIQEHFLAVQVFFAVVFAACAWIFLRSKEPESRFSVRESDRKHDPGPQKRNETQLKLTGARIRGEAHEILGVPRDASAEEIQKSYRALMKQYHPDRIARPGSREWKDAQEIAEALNRARNTMMQKRRPGP